MYAGASYGAALAESVFHDVPVGGSDRRIPIARLGAWLLHPFVTKRDLILGDLRGAGLPRIGGLRVHVIDSPSSEYDYTAAWAEAVLEAIPDLDGLSWTSRQDDTTTSYLLIDRGDAANTYDALHGAQQLDTGAGLTLVEDFASRAGILITRTP